MEGGVVAAATKGNYVELAVATGTMGVAGGWGVMSKRVVSTSEQEQQRLTESCGGINV